MTLQQFIGERLPWGWFWQSVVREREWEEIRRDLTRAREDFAAEPLRSGKWRIVAAQPPLPGAVPIGRGTLPWILATMLPGPGVVVGGRWAQLWAEWQRLPAEQEPEPARW